MYAIINTRYPRYKYCLRHHKHAETSLYYSMSIEILRNTRMSSNNVTPQQGQGQRKLIKQNEGYQGQGQQQQTPSPEQEEEFLAIPPTTIIDADGMRRIAEIEANDEAYRASKFQEIRFKDGDTKIVRIDPTKTEFKEETIKLEGEEPKQIMRYSFSASEYMMGRWTRFKVMKIAPRWGRQIMLNNKEGNLTLKITREGDGFTTNYHIIPTNVKEGVNK